MERSIDRTGFITSLRKCHLFTSLPDEALEKVLEACTLEKYGSGSVVFRVGDPADKVYVVKSGVVEICRSNPNTSKMEVVAYIGAQEPLGEMSILTKSTRASVARVPEKAEIFSITRQAFMDLLMDVPPLAVRLATVLARRLQAWIMKQRLQIDGQELSGSLEYFDPSTLIQTLSHNSRTGLLTIMDRKNEAIAQIYFEEGEVCAGRLGHLKGVEAFYQFFQSSFNGKSFTFKVGKFPEMTKQGRIPHATIALLVEANRLTDELNKLKLHIPSVEKTYRPNVQDFTWEDQSTAPVARTVWHLINQGRPLSHILQKVPVSHYVVYRIISQMLDEGQILP